MSSQAKFNLLTLGEELLLGLTANSHLSYIGDQLRQGGTRVHAHLTLSDSPEEIERYFPRFWEDSSVLITTGGLGPTVDDRTRETVARMLGEGLVFDTEIMEAIQSRFDKLGLQMTDNNRRQAYRFRNGKVLPNPNGTAPGLWLEKDGRILIMLPGPPNELVPMFEEQVLPQLRERQLIASAESYLQIRTVGIGESMLETQLQPIIANSEGLEVAYCAHHGAVDFRLSYPGDPTRYDSLVEIGNRCREMLGDNYLCCGNDSLVKVVSDILIRKELSLAIAESCTGGLLCDQFTDLPGASQFFLGGFTTYSDQSKEELLGVPEEMIRQHSAVSAEVAIAMAAGVAEKLESDYAISTTGYAGPSGGTETSPIGTVFVGLYTPAGIWARKLFFKGARRTIKQRVLNAAVDWLRRELIANQGSEQDANSALRRESAKILRSLK